jgi:hypothetical protein
VRVNEILDQVSNPVKHGLDLASFATPVAIFFNLLPSISALLAAVWLILRIAIGWQEFTINRRKLRSDR